MSGEPLDIPARERLRAIDPTLDGRLPPSAEFIHWLQMAVRLGRISGEREGFSLTPIQAQWWALLEGRRREPPA